MNKLVYALLLLPIICFSQSVDGDQIFFPAGKIDAAYQKVVDTGDTVCLSVTFFADMSIQLRMGVNAEAFMLKTIRDQSYPYLVGKIKIDPTIEYIEENYGDSTSVHDIFWAFHGRPMTTDVGILNTFGGSGGVAAVDQLGGTYPYGVVSVRDFNMPDAPLYSQNANFNAHEVGHVVGTNHTHDCVWNNNGTAIDNCVNNPGCPVGPTTTWGTIMSYCHLLGITRLEFHPQVLALLRQKIIAYHGYCVVEPCENYVDFVIVFDDAREITWSLGDNVGGPYPKDTLSKSVRVCASECDTLKLYDSEGDGLVGECITGFVSINGQDYTFDGDSLILPLCVADTSVGIPCIDVMSGTEIYTQQTNLQNSLTLFTEGNIMTLRGNIFRYLEFSHLVSLNDHVRFEIFINGTAEMHGLGVSEFFNPFGGDLYNLHGTQTNVGNTVTRIEGGQWVTVEIKLFPGQINYIWFMQDNDQNLQSETSFRNLCIIQKESTSPKDDVLYNILGQEVNPRLPGMYFKGKKKIIIYP